jgi:hypothetical protein
MKLNGVLPISLCVRMYIPLFVAGQRLDKNTVVGMRFGKNKSYRGNEYTRKNRSVG